MPIKLRRIIQSIFSVASGCVRITKPNGELELSDQFDISRGVLQGDIFSTVVTFNVGLMRTFAVHDPPNSGVRLALHLTTSELAASNTQMTLLFSMNLLRKHHIASQQ